MPTPQNYKNHTRFEPMFHFFVAPVLLINLIVTIVVLIRRWPHHIWMHAWLLVMAIALFLLAGIARSYAAPCSGPRHPPRREPPLPAPAPTRALAATQSLTLGQIIALRFASDAELPALVQRTLSENLAPKAIKQSITNWRADNLRV